MTFTTAIVKLTSTCNLACSYCYMFNLTDRTYESVPGAMATDTAERLVDRIGEYVLAQDLRSFTVVLHGGEPTLWPLASFSRFFKRVEAWRRRGASIRVVMQTNGLALRPVLADLFSAHGVRLGFSLDGPASANDANRVNLAGRGSYDMVMRTVSRLVDDGHEGLITGFLSVVQPSVPVEDYLDWLSSLPVPRINLIWPIEYHWSAPPWRAGSESDYRARPVYGTWLADLFRAWWSRDDPQLHIELFFESIMTLLGSGVHTDALVNDSIASFVVNTDGGYEYSDYFRASGNGRTRTSLTVASNPIAELLKDPVFEFCSDLRRYLPRECVSCRHAHICGGGFLPGRMAPQQLLPLRRSVLCYDHMAFFDEVATVVAGAEDR